jgi:hypothetical protein
MFTHKNAHTDYIKFIERFRILKRRKSLERLHCMSKDIFEHDNSTSSVSTGRQEEKNVKLLIILWVQINVKPIDSWVNPGIYPVGAVLKTLTLSAMYPLDYSP